MDDRYRDFWGGELLKIVNVIFIWDYLIGEESGHSQRALDGEQPT